ncbi:MAG TPA: hypothetical protein VF040_19250 [Ktedonobacterales bacterium]
MRALQNIHAALRPGGLLLDIHPEPENPWLEARTGERIVRLGKLDVSCRTETVLSARESLQRVIDAGLFVRERDITFTFIYHFASPDAWNSYMSEHWSTARLPAGMVERADDALSSGAGELCIPRDLHATRLRKPG